MKTNTCIPWFRTNAAACGRRNHHISQMSVLDRVREAVFRVIMLFALSKASSAQQANNNAGVYYREEANYHRSPEPHHSEAVADCIEFIKKSATTKDGHDSTVSNGSYAGEVIFPSPVM